MESLRGYDGWKLSGPPEWAPTDRTDCSSCGAVVHPDDLATTEPDVCIDCERAADALRDRTRRQYLLGRFTGLAQALAEAVGNPAEQREPLRRDAARLMRALAAVDGAP